MHVLDLHSRFLDNWHGFEGLHYLAIRYQRWRALLSHEVDGQLRARRRRRVDIAVVEGDDVLLRQGAEVCDIIVDLLKVINLGGNVMPKAICPLAVQHSDGGGSNVPARLAVEVLKLFETLVDDAPPVGLEVLVGHVHEGLSEEGEEDIDTLL